jgi:WD40 repeat protein
MILPGRYREHLVRILRSYWLVVVVTVAVGAITWRFCPPQPRLTFQNSEGWAPFGFSPDCNILGATTQTGGHDIAIWDAQSGEELERLTLPDVEMEKTTFSPEGELVLVHDGRIRLRAVPFGVEKETEIRDVWRVGFSADGQRAVVHCAGRLEVWDWPKRQLLVTVPLQEFQCETFSLSPDCATLAAGNDEGLQFWDVATARKGPGSQPIDEITLPYSSLAPNHKILVTWDTGGQGFCRTTAITVKLWRISGTPGEGLKVVPYGEPTPVAFPPLHIISPDSKMIAITTERKASPGSFWNRVQRFFPWLDLDRDGYETVLLDLESSERVAVLPGSGAGAFSSDSRHFAKFGPSDKIHLWDIPPRKPMAIVLSVAAIAGTITWLVRRWFLRASRPRAT